MEEFLEHDENKIDTVPCEGNGKSTMAAIYRKLICKRLVYNRCVRMNVM